MTSYTKRHPLAIAGAWRAASGDVGIALASIADRPLAVSLALDAEYHDLPEPARAYRIDERGRRPIEWLDDDDPSLNLELPPCQAWIIEFSGN